MGFLTSVWVEMEVEVVQELKCGVFSPSGPGREQNSYFSVTIAGSKLVRPRDDFCSSFR